MIGTTQTRSQFKKSKIGKRKFNITHDIKINKKSRTTQSTSITHKMRLRPIKQIDYRNDIVNDSSDDSDYDPKSDSAQKNIEQPERKQELNHSVISNYDLEIPVSCYQLLEKIRNTNSLIPSSDELITYGPEYTKIMDNIKDTTPDVMTILKSNLSFHDKCSAMDLLEILSSSGPSIDKIQLKNKINIMLENANLPMKKKNMIEVLNDIVNHKKNLRDRIIDSDEISDNDKAIIYEKYIKWESLQPTDHDKAKLREWIEYALLIPRTIKPLTLYKQLGRTEINIYLCHVQSVLDEKIYGMDNVKREILLILNNKLINPESKNNHLALIGPPGVGKTEIMRSLASALDLPFQQICMGGVEEVSFLDGNGYVFEGSSPGIIVKSLKKMGYKNGVLFFDEMDKISKDNKGRAVAWNLLHILDSTQNNNFRDKYLDELEIDLSKIWFVYSLNNDDMLDKALKDRIDIIRVDDYTNKEKVQIAKLHLIPRACKDSGILDHEVTFSDNIIEYINSKTRGEYTGVRQLNRNIQKIVRIFSLVKNAGDKKGSLGYLRFDIKHKLVFPLIVTKSIVDDCLIYRKN